MKRLTASLALVFLCLPAWGATCKITEYTDVINVNIPAAHENGSVTRLEVTYTTAADSAPFQSTTRFIRVVCDAKAHYIISATGNDEDGNNVDASDPYLPADTPEYFGVNGGHIFSAYDGSS